MIKNNVKVLIMNFVLKKKAFDKGIFERILCCLHSEVFVLP